VVEHLPSKPDALSSTPVPPPQKKKKKKEKEPKEEEIFSQQKLRGFITTRPPLQELLKRFFKLK
jgi:hypothetical protein